MRARRLRAHHVLGSQAPNSIELDTLSRQRSATGDRPLAPAPARAAGTLERSVGRLRPVTVGSLVSSRCGRKHVTAGNSPVAAGAVDGVCRIETVLRQ